MCDVVGYMEGPGGEKREEGRIYIATFHPPHLTLLHPPHLTIFFKK